MTVATFPLSWAWQLVAEARRRHFDRHPDRAARVDVPVISVGGIEVGGSGKSPVAAYLLERLLLLQQRPGLLTRGYARRTRGLVVRHEGEIARADAIGDEAAMMVHEGLDVPVAAVARRIVGARALQSHGCNAIVLDDGFVHRALHRDVDVVVLSASLRPDELAFVPTGRLRESVHALSRAHLLWWHDKGDAPLETTWQDALVRRYAPGLRVVRSFAWLEEARDGAGRTRPLRECPVVAACGIARPQSFVDALTRAGARVVATAFAPDHAAATRRRFAQSQRLARSSGARAIVVTAKDWTSWQPLAAQGAVPVWVAPQHMALRATDVALVDALLLAQCVREI